MAYVDENLNDPTNFFDTHLYSGNDSTNNQSVGLTPDLVWVKSRNTGSPTQHYWVDSVRGDKKYISSNASTTEATDSNTFDLVSGGFNLAGGNGWTNLTGRTYCAWNWAAGGLTPSITYSVKVVSDSGNKYRFDDFGTSAVTLDLQEGGTYTFDQSDSSNSGHPLRFSTTSDGTHGGGSEFTTNVTTTGTPGSAGAKTIITISASAPTLYYYCTQHSGMGGQANTNSTRGSSNFSGSIQSVVSANTTAGFSIVKWSASANKTIGHGLGQKPAMVITKSRDTGTNWATWHQHLTGGSEEDRFLNLNSTGGTTTYTDYFGTGGFTSSVFGVSNSGFHNNSGEMIAYCFAEKKGFSKISSFVGNGSSDGTYVYLGFRPAFILYKVSSASSDWYLQDNKRLTYNVNNTRLEANNSDAEVTGAADSIDMLSNGFKMRHSSSSFNNSGATYIYYAVAESPFVNSNGVPNNAR